MMRNLRDYLTEAEFIAENPVPGDWFDIEVDTDTLIETVITEIDGQGGMVIELDEHAMGLLKSAGYVFEDTNDINGDDGQMSPISGTAFIPYNRKSDPRDWMRTDVPGDKPVGKDPVTMSGVPSDKHPIKEAEYHGHQVPLGKKMSGDVKKSKVYVRKPNGKIVKVNFGDKNMRIKKSNPARRRSFRARHHCENPGPRWKARYWSCRSW